MSRIEPPRFVDHIKLYAIYKMDLKIWSQITSIEKKAQAEVIVQILDGHSSGIMEKIQAGIRDIFEGNKQGIEVLINFLDDIHPKKEDIKKQKVP